MDYKQELQYFILQYTPTTLKQLKRKDNTQETSSYRNAIWYMLSLETTLSLSQIGKIFDRDHTTILSGQNRMKYMIANEPDMAEFVREMVEEFKEFKKASGHQFEGQANKLVIPKRRKKSHPNIYSAKPKSETTKTRSCLRCGKNFKSHGPGNRLCPEHSNVSSNSFNTENTVRF